MSESIFKDDSSSSPIEISPLDDEDNVSLLMSFNNMKPSSLVIALTFVSSISGFMFGYDTGYISSALVAIGNDISKNTLTYGQKEFITSSTSLGALIGGVFAGLIADIIGRKKVIIGSNVLFVIGAIIQVAAQTVWTMIAGRFVMGFGVGIGSLISPLYISELAPSRFRGRLVIINCLAITGGQLIAYGIGAGLTHVNNGWRILVGLSMIPPVVQFVLFFFLPDTPRYLISKGKIEEAREVIKKTHKGTSDELVSLKIKELTDAATEIDGKNTFEKTWNAIKEIHAIPSNFRALVLACGLQGIQQFTGFNSLMYFSSTIFESIGFKNSNAVSIIVAGTNFVFTILAFFVIDRVGRRRILLITIPGMLVSLVVCAVAFHFVDLKFVNHSAVIQTRGITGWGIVIIVGMICYVATYALGIGNVPWQQSELFAQSVRGVGTSYATATNWAGSLIISSTFLTMLENITPTGTFTLFGAICLVSWVFVLLFYPELSGLELEETQKILTGGFNIKKSQILAAERKKARQKFEKPSIDKVSDEIIEKVV